MTGSKGRSLLEWLNRPFYTQRGVVLGPKLTNFAVVAVVLLTVVALGVIWYAT